MMFGRPLFSSNTPFWKGVFSFPPVELDFTTQVLSKVCTQGEWTLDVLDLVVAATHDQGVKTPIYKIKKHERMGFFVRDVAGHETAIPKQYIMEKAFDNVDFFVVMVPSIFPCKMGEIDVDVVGYVGVSKKGHTALIGFDPRRFSFGGTFECINLKDLNEASKIEDAYTSPGLGHEEVVHDVEWVKSLPREEGALKRAWFELVGRQYVPGDMEYDEHDAASLLLEDLITEVVAESMHNKEEEESSEEGEEDEEPDLLEKGTIQYKDNDLFNPQPTEVKVSEKLPKFKDITNLIKIPYNPKDEEDPGSFMACMEMGMRAKRERLEMS